MRALFVAAGTVVGGVPVALLDTAGVRDARDAVERLGVQRSRAAARAANIVLVVYDATVSVLCATLKQTKKESYTLSLTSFSQYG